VFAEDPLATVLLLRNPHRQVLKLLTCTDQSMAAVSGTTRSLQKSMNQPPNTSILG
jgi:hypothetical protein